jgi:hypothetical protein
MAADFGRASSVQVPVDLTKQSENTIFVRVFIPEQNLQVCAVKIWTFYNLSADSSLQKCLLFERNATVWKAKQLVLQKLAKVSLAVSTF